MKKNVGVKKMDMSFSGLLGGSPRVKIWEFLLVSRGNFEYNIKDIAKGSEITRPTCHKEVEELKKREIIVKGTKYHGKQLYKLNKESVIVNAMQKSFHSLLYEQ